MKYNIKTFIITSVILVLGIFGFILFGLYLMEKEDKYGDLVYLKDELRDGDILMYKTYESSEQYIDYGIVDISISGLNIFDRKNTLKKDIYKWVDDNKIQKVKAFRPLISLEETVKIDLLKNIHDSTKFEYIGETY